jgi:hypothetical protein
MLQDVVSTEAMRSGFIVEGSGTGRTAVKDSSSAVTGAPSLRRRGAGVCGAAVQGCGGAGADQLGGGQPGPGFLDDQARGPDRRTGPLVRFPAPVIVVSSSPNVVSDALHRVRYVSRTASAGAAR